MVDSGDIDSYSRKIQSFHEEAILNICGKQYMQQFRISKGKNKTELE